MAGVILAEGHGVGECIRDYRYDVLQARRTTRLEHEEIDSRSQKDSFCSTLMPGLYT